jgi:hypothetical protein
VKGEKNENKGIDDRLSVEAQCPIGSFVFCKKEKTRQYLDAEENNE